LNIFPSKTSPLILHFLFATSNAVAIGIYDYIEPPAINLASTVNSVKVLPPFILAII
jgi:hypothetical protein